MSSKIRATHLSRRALVYLRQSSARQVFENVESTSRQYALAERATALGWPSERVEVIDDDLGQSGTTTDGRSGFARVAHAVAHGHAGAVVALEVSRLARSSQDWQRLLTLCAVARVVVIDENSVYDPRHSDDKLLLDLKGTMSEVELHWLRLRLVGAKRSKAARGALRMAPPTGYLWGENGFEKDPDQAVRHAVETVFSRFAVEPSAWAVIRWARDTGFRMPTRRCFAQGETELVWKPLSISRLCHVLRNPTYAGVYAYGRHPEEAQLVNGRIRKVRLTPTPDTWSVRIEGAHPGYITWETYVDNRKKLKDNLKRLEPAGRGAPREGRALLAGLVLCGRCGRPMRTSYWRKTGDRWSYVCPGDRERGLENCWSVAGAAIDAAVEDLFLKAMVPEELELCLAVEREVEAQAEALDRQWRLRLDAARYEARRAERRYKAVDPDNRVVASTLERDWEMRLRDLEDVHAQYEQARRVHRVQLGEEDREKIRALARDLPAVWSQATTRPAERKAMLRLAIEAVALHPIDVPARGTRLRVQWQGGHVTDVTLPRPHGHERSRTPRASVERIRALAAEGCRDEQIAERLNAEKAPKATADPWTPAAVKWARRKHGIPRVASDRPRVRPLPDRFPDGRYSIRGACHRFDVSDGIVRGWIKRGLVRASQENYQQRRVYWLHIDDESAERLQQAADRIHSRQKSKK